MIEISGLGKRFGDLEVLKDINLTIEDGDIYGLVGMSGAGKSTLLRCINGLISYDTGSIKIDGVEVKDLGEKELRYLQKDIAMIFQHFDLMSRKTVYQNIAFPMQCWKYSKNEIDERVRELAKIVGIEDKLDQYPKNLSGGQKQRVAIARALTMNPKILLSDEATSALDPITTQSILDLLRQISRDLKITIIMVTHEMAVIKNACRNISLLENGELVVAGPVKGIFADQPAAFKRFLGEHDELPATGCNLRLVIPDYSESKYRLSEMSRDLGIDFALVSGKIERFSDEDLGLFTLNFRDEDAALAKEYLSGKGIDWRECVEDGGDGR